MGTRCDWFGFRTAPVAGAGDGVVLVQMRSTTKGRDATAPDPLGTGGVEAATCPLPAP